MKNKLWLVGNAVVVFGALLLVWWAFVLALKLPPYMLPTPWAVAKTVAERLPDLWEALMISAEAAAGGLAASIVVGVLISLVFARSKWIRQMLFPYTILLGGAGDVRGGRDYVHRMLGTDYCEYNAGARDGGGEPGAALPDA
jgi:NitT/TauT family transport system permease protein